MLRALLHAGDRQHCMFGMVELLSLQMLSRALISVSDMVMYTSGGQG
jgi:hypothetical protein